MKARPGRPRKDPAVRFWSKVNKTDYCWNWTDAPNNDGYGRLGTNGRHTLAHRFSWELHGLGELGANELDHRCLNRMCVNPDHLRIVTRKQNCENISGAMRNSETGVRGVKRNRNGRPYSATVHHNGERFYLGRFDTIEDAECAAIAKRLELFTHNEVDRASNHANAARRIGATP